MDATTAPREAIEYLCEVFNEELAGETNTSLYGLLVVACYSCSPNFQGGQTYPQEGPLTLEAFSAYFFGAQTIMAIVSPDEEEEVSDGTPFTEDIETARSGRSWKDCIGGCYYMSAR
jgi:hypothetical protein